MVNFRLELAHSAVAHAEKELREWLQAVQKYPGLESFLPDNERILRMNLKAAAERVARLIDSDTQKEEQ